MGSVVQFAAFFCIGSLILSVATPSNQDENEKWNNKRSNPDSSGEGDFYFVEEKVNDNNIKSGRAIHQTAWSKEDKEPSLSFEKKTNSQFSDESSIKKVLSYLLNVVQELKKDIFGLKEVAIPKETNESPNAQDNSKDKANQNKMDKNLNVSKPLDSTENIELKNKNYNLTPNYITDYYRNNGIESTDDEKDDDLEKFSDLSDDSSHKPDERTSKREVRKNNENKRSVKCVNIKNKPKNCNFVSMKATVIPIVHTKINDEANQSKESGNCSDCKESTEKPAKTEQNHSKESREETKSRTVAFPNSKRCKCEQNNNKNPANKMNEKNNPAKKTLKSEYRSDSKVNPQDEDSDPEESKMSKQDKIVDITSLGNNAKNKYGSEFHKEPSIQSIVMNSQVSTVPENVNKNEHKAFETPSSKQQEQLYSQKPGDKKKSQENAKVFEHNDGINEQITVSFHSHELVLETPEQKVTTEAYTSDTEFDGSPKDEGSKVIPTEITKSNNENKPNEENDGQKTSNSYYIGNTITPITSENTMNKDKLNENPSKNVSDKTGTNENEDSENLKPRTQEKNDSEIQNEDVTDQTKIEKVNDTKTEKSSENQRLNDSNSRKDTIEKNDNLDSMTASDFWSQNSDQEIQNDDNRESDQENLEKLTQRTEMQDSPDQEYEYEEDTEDFDIWDDDDTEASDQIQESEQDTNIRDLEKPDKIISGTVLSNASQITQTTGYMIEEKSGEQFDTFLEYFYKHSNNSFFESLKNLSNSFSDEEN